MFGCVSKMVPWVSLFCANFLHHMFSSLNIIPINYRGWTLRDFLERLPREWISEELMEKLEDKGVHLSPTM